MFCFFGFTLQKYFVQIRQIIYKNGLSIRDATQSPRKSPIFSSLKIGEGGGQTLVWEKLKLKIAKIEGRGSGYAYF